MKVKFGLRLKITLLFFVFILFITVVMYCEIQDKYITMYQDQQIDYAKTIVQLVEETISKEELNKYIQTKEEDEEYLALIEEMKEIQDRAEFYYLYVVYAANDKDGMYIFDLRRPEKEKIVFQHRLGKSNHLKKNYPGLDKALQQKDDKDGKQKKKFYASNDGNYKLQSLYYPVDSGLETGRVFVGVDYKTDDLEKETRKFLRPIFGWLFTAMGGCFLVLLVSIHLAVIKPVYELAEHARKVSEEKFDTELRVRGHDEFSEIMKVFNRMTKSIAGNMEEMQRLNEAYYRYVPSRILALLGKEGIRDIGLGDEAHARLAVMSIQMADFERNIRKKSTDEMLRAINQILEISVSVVSERAGMIESIENAGFTALFDNNCESVLSGAVTICQRLNMLEQSGQIDRNRIGIGIAYGYVTLGIVGHEKRMAAITVSQFRDLACFLQEVAERYQSHILVTQETVDNIPGFSGMYHSRMLGFLYNTYTGYTSRIYDVYDGDSRNEIVCKDATKEVFEQGVEYYCLGEFRKARQNFIEVLKNFRKDRASKEYLYLCDQKCMQREQNGNDIYFIRME